VSADKPAEKPAATPEDQAKARLADLKTQVQALEKENRTLSGRVANRSGVRMSDLEKEAQLLKLRLGALEKALFEIIEEGFQPQTPEELRLSALEYFKESNTNPELWKNLAY
jgi:hypothetical protein